MCPSLPSWIGQFCCSRHCSILSAFAARAISFKGATLSPQILPAFCVGCWCIGLAATLVWESFLETSMLILYGNLLDKMSNSRGAAVFHTAPGSVFHFLIMYKGFGWEDCAPCPCCLFFWAVAAAGSPSDLGGELGMQWQTSRSFQSWGNALAGCLLRSTARYLARWGYFPSSPSKKGEKPEVGSSFKTKAASSPCTCKGSTPIAQATTCTWCRAALMALPFSLQSEDVRWPLCSPWWCCCGRASQEHSPSEELPTFMGIAQACQTHTTDEWVV